MKLATVVRKCGTKDALGTGRCRPTAEGEIDPTSSGRVVIGGQWTPGQKERQLAATLPLWFVDRPRYTSLPSRGDKPCTRTLAI